MIDKMVSHYRVLEKLGGGGMGVVYEAEDTMLGRHVALKFLPNPGDREAVGRFIKEARAAASLEHPNICTIYDLGSHEGSPFIVMELMRGETLKYRVGRGALKLDDVIDLSIQLADALDAAHSLGVVHRDIKPANIFVTERGQAKVLDFGLVKLARQAKVGDRPYRTPTLNDETLTRPGTAVGTLAYMSPEQALGEEVDTRSDLFSLGAVIYEMATGVRAFRDHNVAALYDSIVNRQPPPAKALNSKLPSKLDEIIIKALDKDRMLRYQNAADMLADLRRMRRETGPWGSSAARAAMASPAGVAVPSAEPESGTRQSAAIEALAVLPFEIAGSDPDSEYLSDGITENIISNLSQLAHLRVVPRSTVFRHKRSEEDPQTIGRSLDVTAVLTGRVFEREGTLVVRVELINVVRDSQIWGGQYRKTIYDIFEVQEEIAQAISEKLKIQLSPEEKKSLTKRATEDTGAYQSYLKGRYHWNKRSEGGTRQAIRHFQQAIDQDPNYGLAYSGLADAFMALGYYNYTPPKDSYSKAKAAARRALELDPTLAEAHASLGFAGLFFDRNWAETEREFKRAIDLKPGYPTGHQWYAWYLLVMERFDEALEEMRRAQELDPLSLIINDHLGYSLLLAGFPDDATVQLRKTIELDPEFSLAYWRLGFVFIETGRYAEAVPEFQRAVELSDGRLALGYLALAHGFAGNDEMAREATRRLEELSKEHYVSPLEFALAHAGIGELDQAFEALDRAYDDQVSDLSRVKLLPWPEDLRQDGRFGKHVSRLGLNT